MLCLEPSVSKPTFPMLCPMFCLICLTNIGNSYDRGTQLELELKCQANIPRCWEGAFVGALKSLASGIRISGNYYIKKSPGVNPIKPISASITSKTDSASKILP